MTMLPAWGTVLIALGASALGGVVGALLTTFVRIRHERDEQRRARLLEAADDFLKPLGSGRIALGGVERHLRTERPGDDEWIRMAGDFD
jgi:membrane protein YqaA with SNARE-associated domain